MKSMTGFGKSHIITSEIECEVEIKSVNGRYQDLKIHLPREFGFFEHIIRKEASRKLSRGTIEIRVNINDLREPDLRLNEDKLKKYYDIIKQAQKILDIDEKPPLQYLLDEPGVIQTINQYDKDPDMISVLQEALQEAFNSLNESLLSEAEDIRKVLVDSFEDMQKSLDKIKLQIQPFKEELFENMHKRITEIVGSYKLDNIEQRIVQELAIYIDKYDVQEEITRLESHIQTFIQCLEKDEAVDIGKTLNFILQEMLREANTLGSKFSNSRTFGDVLIIKEEIEKCREIVQNVA